MVAPASAQDDVVARARAASSDGRRAEGLQLLETHLASNPRDADARLVYGLILSWDGRYDDARRAFAQVLAQAPGYLDAQVGLMNIEWWSGNTRAARDLVNAILTRDAGNLQARLVQRRLDARTRPWSAGVAYTHDIFNDDREPWNETAISLGRETPVGSMMVRGSQADRFGLSDRQVEVEFYPTFRAGTYAFVGVGFGADKILYPEHRVSFDLYQALGGGFELSGGYRRLQFAERADIYLATLTKYVGNWMITGKASYVPDPRLGDAWSYYGQLRRYFGAEGTSFVGVLSSHGFSRDEPRGAGDLVMVNADTVKSQLQVDVAPWVRLSAEASTARQERASSTPLWQTTLAAGLKFRF